MSMIEKAAQRYKKKSANSNKKIITAKSALVHDDKTEIMQKNESLPDQDNKFKTTPQTSPVNNSQQVYFSLDAEDISRGIEDEDISQEDQNQFPDEDITDISGFAGYSIKATKSKHSKNVHIDLNKLNDNGFLTPKHPDSLLSSIFRMIKSPILNNAKGKGASVVEHPNLIQVTSSFANEGKTYSAINIAISIAMEQDLNVLLIDADIRKPSIAKTFNIDDDKGLTDLISGKVDDMKSVLYNTNIPSLSIMCAGTSHPNGTELLSSKAMYDFIEEVSSRYSDRIIIFDSPPLLQTTESTTLASHMGQIVLVVEAEKTMAPQVKKSIEILQNEIVLLLLNKQREKKNDITYGYGYGY